MSARLRVLMIAYYFPPCGGAASLRALRWARHLPDEGLEVTVLAPDSAAFPVTDPTLLGRVPAGTEVHRVKAFLPSSGAAVRAVRGGSYSDRPAGPLAAAARRSLRWMRDVFFVPDEYVGFASAAARRARALHRARPFDALLTLSQPHSVHLAGLALRRAPGLPWVAQLADPWSENWFAPPSSFTRRMLEPRMERRVLTGCDTAVGTTECLRDRWRARFPGLTSGRFQSLVVGYDEQDFAGVPPERFERWTLAHVGSLYLDRSAGPFLEGLAAYLAAHPGERERISVVFLGAKDEANKREFRSAIARLGLDGTVEDRGFRPHREALGLITGAQALLYLGGDPPEGDLNIQSKVFEYLRAGKPVLAVSRDVEAARILSRAPFFIRSERGDADGVKTALERLRALPPEAPGAPAVAAAGGFEASALARSLAGWLREAVEAHRAPRQGGGAR